MYNTTNQKQYLVIRNCCTNNHLRSYLEQICREEKCHIIEEYVSSNWFVNESRPSLYEEHGAKPSFDALLESYSLEKLRYIEYLYNIYEKQYRYSGNIVSKVLKDVEFQKGTLQGLRKESDFVIGEIKVGITDEVHVQMTQWEKDIADSITKQFQDVYNINSKYTQPHVYCEFRAPDTRDKLHEDIKAWITDWNIGKCEPRKQSKFQIFKQKAKEYWDNTAFEKTFALIGLIMVLTIILNVVK